MATLWTSDAYAPGDFSLWSGQQEQSSNDVTVVAPPAEVGGGPQSRSFLGRYRIDSGDGDPFGIATAQRAEAVKYTTEAGGDPFDGRSGSGQEIWFAWESYFGNPSTVADANAYRPSTGTAWNAFTQWHQPGSHPGTVPWIIEVDARSGSTASAWRWMVQTRGGAQGAATSIVNHDLGAFSYGWHEYKVYIRWSTVSAPTSGRAKVWIDGDVVMDYTGVVGYWFSNGSPVINYWKQGMYRGKSSNNCTVYHGGTRMGTTEADVDEEGGGDPDPPAGTPDANTQDRRFGKATVGAGRNGFSGDSKRGSKFATGLAANEEADVKDIHLYVEGMDGSASTQKLTVGFYADDGGSGAPGTKFGESDVEIELAGNVAGDWVKISPTAIRVTGANAWIVVGSSTPSNRLRYATDPVTNGLFFDNDADTYDVAPFLEDPFGAGALTNLEMSVCADYDVVAGSSGGGGDTTAPSLTSAVVILADAILLEYDEPLDTTVVPDESDYIVLVNGAPQVPSSVGVTGSQVQLLLTTPISPSATVLLTYARVVDREVRDLAGNIAGNLDEQPVENQTPTEPTVASRSITTARSTSIARVSNPSAREPGLGGGGL